MSTVDLQKAREEAATLEARLIILRQRARACARSMQDRGTDRSGRNAAGVSWAQARMKAEKVELEFRAAQERVQELETERTGLTGRSDAPRQTSGRDRALPVAPVNDLADAPSDGPPGLPGATRGYTDDEGRATSGAYYTPRQAAEMLGTDVAEVNRLARRGELRGEWIRRQLWYAARPLEDLVRKRRGPTALAQSPEPRMMSPTAVRRSAGDPPGSVYRQPGYDPPIPKGGPVAGSTARYHTDEGATDAPKPKEGAPSTSPKCTYYTVEQVADKLGMKDAYEVWHLPNVGQLKIKGVKVGGRRVFSKEAVDKLVAEGEKARILQKRDTSAADGDERAARRPENEDRDESPRGAEDLYYTLEEAEALLGRNFYKAARRTLPTVTAEDQVWVKAAAVDNLVRGKYGGGKLYGAPKPRTVRLPSTTGRDGSGAPDERDLRALREANERLTEELRRVQGEHLREVQKMRRDVDQLSAELENVRRSPVDGAVGLRLKRERELRQEAERRAQVLEARLNEESLSRSGEARRLAALESEFDRSEARRKELEEVLASEKEKVRRLEESERLLDKVRRVLGGVGEVRPSGRDDNGAPEGAAELGHDEPSVELALRTPFGQVRFKPPFPLAEQDEELLRLIAREEELTAEQVRKHTGRRRAAADFEDLLDRLADEGMKDLIVEVSEDRYRFNPAALQDD